MIFKLAASSVCTFKAFWNGFFVNWEGASGRHGLAWQISHRYMGCLLRSLGLVGFCVSRMDGAARLACEAYYLIAPTRVADLGLGDYHFHGPFTQVGKVQTNVKTGFLFEIG